MTDEFDRFLAQSLAPQVRSPDRAFVATVQMRIALEHRLARERSALVGGLVAQIAALLAVAASLWVIGRAAPVANWVAASPSVALLVLFGAFGCFVALCAQSDPRSVARA